MVGGPDVQTPPPPPKKKKNKKKNETWLFDWKYQLGLAFGSLFTSKN